jgi:hypothetical protein
MFSGKEPFNLRQVNKIMELNGKTRWLANFVPDFIIILLTCLKLKGSFPENIFVKVLEYLHAIECNILVKGKTNT